MSNSPLPERPICDYEDSTYRTDFWQGQGREYEDAVERVALRRLLPSRGMRLVDIGAGFGRLADLYDGYDEVVLLDYSQSQLEYARSQLGDGRYIYVAADIYRLPLSKSAVDTAVMVRVLHHIADVPEALSKVAHALAPQGTFILEFANKRHLKNIVRYLLGRGPNPFGREPFQFADLHFDFHPAWVQARVREAGLRIESRLAVSMLRVPFLKRHLPKRWLVALDAVLQRIAAPCAPSPSVFLRGRSTDSGDPRPVDRAALFRCPSCGHEPLQHAQEGLVCLRCEARWPMVNGVYVFK